MSIIYAGAMHMCILILTHLQSIMRAIYETIGTPSTLIFALVHTCNSLLQIPNINQCNLVQVVHKLHMKQGLLVYDTKPWTSYSHQERSLASAHMY